MHAIAELNGAKHANDIMWEVARRSRAEVGTEQVHVWFGPFLYDQDEAFDAQLSQPAA
jgi:hypothetical protein